VDVVQAEYLLFSRAQRPDKHVRIIDLRLTDRLAAQTAVNQSHWFDKKYDEQ